MWRNNYQVMVDITTRCNAGCPQCHRTNIENISKKVDWLPDINWDLETFKKAYPPEVCQSASMLDFCGTWGDPIANNNLPDIVKYIQESNPNCEVNINTNGSMRNEEWWWNLMTAGGKNLIVVFAVEGTTQEMHEGYRRNTFLDKILKNMELVSNSPARIHTQTLVWKHNEDYLEEIEDMCIKHGSHKHHIMLTDRWKNTTKDDNYKANDNVLNFKNHKGEDLELRKTDLDPLKNNSTYGLQKDRRRYTRKTTTLATHSSKRIREMKELKRELDITCEWGVKNRVLVNPDGQVWPCCFFCNVGFKEKYTPDSHFHKHPLIKEYEKYEKELNVFGTNNLNDIINHHWFKTLLPQSWNTDNPVPQCAKHCGKFSAIDEMVKNAQ